MSAIPIGQKFVRFATSTSATAVFTNTANTNGAYLRTVTLVCGNPTSTSTVSLIADTAAPSSISDTSKRSIFNGVVDAGLASTFTLPYELQVPAGWGVWAIATDANWGVFITYDLLSA